MAPRGCQRWRTGSCTCRRASAENSPGLSQVATGTERWPEGGCPSPVAGTRDRPRTGEAQQGLSGTSRQACPQGPDKEGRNQNQMSLMGWKCEARPSRLLGIKRTCRLGMQGEGRK